MSEKKIERKYQFHWDLLGDIEAGRPNLGNRCDVALYRLMQFSFRDVIEQKFGSEKADEVFYEAGYLAGMEFYQHQIKPTQNFEDFVKELQKKLKENGVGILRLEKADLEKKEFILTVSEDLDCSGLPELDFEICTYDEGFIAALLESFSGEQFEVKEIDCWCTGDRTCRFQATGV